MDAREAGISKEECQEYLRNLITDAVPKGYEAVSNATGLFLQYLAQNYVYLDSDAKELADKIFEESIIEAEKLIKPLPDNAENRDKRRKLGAIKKQFPSGKGLIATLTSESRDDLPLIIETKDFFNKYFQTLLDTLYDIIESSMEGTASFAKSGLLFCSIDELLCSYHLAQRGYANQAYTHIRTILEIIDKIELFILDESYVGVWSSDDIKKKLKELKPSAVRKKLNKEKVDPVYSFFSAYGSHSTWEFVSSKSAYKAGTEENKPKVKFTLGGTQDKYHFIIANAFCAFALMQVLLQAGKAFENRIHEEDFSSVLIECIKDFEKYFIKVAETMGANTEDFKEYFANLKVV